MTSRLVVDDHLLCRLLVDDEPASLRPFGARIATTGLWYHRLCRALSDPTVTGALSRLVGGEPAVGAAATAAVIDLPEAIELVSWRAVAWPMARTLAGGVRLNLLGLEALAVAEHLDAELCLAEADDNPPLREAAAKLGRPVRLVVD